LAPTITEAENSCNLPSASWRLREVDAVTKSEAKGLKIRVTAAVNLGE
jgi:hypothetical protein